MVSVQWAAAALLISVAPAPSRHRQTTPSPSDKQQLPIPIASRFPLAECRAEEELEGVMAHQQRHSPSSFRSWKTASRGNRSRDSMDSPTPSSHLDDMHIPLASPRSPGSSILSSRSCESRRKLSQSKALSRRALLENDSLVYLDGPQVYTCGECRTHMTSHDDIISKSFHGRHGKQIWSRGLNLTVHVSILTGMYRASVPVRPVCQHQHGSSRRSTVDHGPTLSVRHLLQTLQYSYWMDIFQGL